MTGCEALALSSVSVKERIRAMEQRSAEDLDCATCMTRIKQIAVDIKEPPATLDNEDAASVASSASTASVNSTAQYTSMTRKARKLRKDRYHRRSQNKKEAAKKEINVTTFVDEPCAEERNPQQDELEEKVLLTSPGAKRDEATDVPNDSAPDEGILDDIIDSLFEAEGNDEQIPIEPLPSFPFPEDGEEMDANDEVMEGRDEDDAKEESRCPTPNRLPNKQNMVEDPTCVLPPTPLAQDGSLLNPPALAKRTNILLGRSKYQPVTPDANADSIIAELPLPSLARNFLSLPTLEESPLEEFVDSNTDNLRSTSPLCEDQILEKILSEEDDSDSGSVVSIGSTDSGASKDVGNNCAVSLEDAITSIMNRPSLDDDEEDGSEYDSISTSPSLGLIGLTKGWTSRPIDWKENHTCVLRY